MLVIATGNAHKFGEFEELLPDLPLASLADFPAGPEVEETAPDYAGNAIIKALAAHELTGRPCLADDSGFEVAALDWGPGIRSARYTVGSDQDRIDHLLAAVGDATDRRARFQCVIAIAGLPDDLPLTEGLWRQGGCVLGRGTLEGTLAAAPRGEDGFGYDPVCVLEDGRSVAELGAAEKHAVSHRGRAARAVAPFLRAAANKDYFSS